MGTTYVDNTMLTLSKLDAFIATAVSCFHDSGTHKVGCYRRNLYRYKVLSFLPKTYDQLVGSLRTFVEE